VPRPRTKTAAPKKKSAARPRRKRKSAASTTDLICPECGKGFTRAASLGAHRSRAHGVAGANSRTARSAAASKRSAAPAQRRPRSRADASGGRFDRDGLLGLLFPNGIPPREGVIREVNAWLDQAERIARSAA
jgi:hypothetical protein